MSASDDVWAAVTAIAARAEVAREHAAVGEVLRGERELGCDARRDGETDHARSDDGDFHSAGP